MISTGRTGLESQNVRHFREVQRELVGVDTCFRSALVKQLYDWWFAFQPDLPRRAAFDILDHRKLVPYLYLYRINDPETVEYRLSGETVATAIGRQQAGMVFSVRDDDQEKVALAEYVFRVANARQPHRCFGTLAFVDKRHVAFESIDCPLSGEDGEVSHVVGLLVPDFDEPRML